MIVSAGDVEITCSRGQNVMPNTIWCLEAVLPEWFQSGQVQAKGRE